MSRYFVALSYMSYTFKASVKTSKIPDITTVAGAVDVAIRSLRNIKRASPLRLSSRTDGGVHALYNTAHVDIEWCNLESVNLECFKKGLNKFFFTSNLSLLILDIKPVSENFSARYCAKKRKYVYRLAVPKDKSPQALDHYRMPMSEWKRCHFLQTGAVNINALKETFSLFLGIHDFTSFIKKSPEKRSPLHFLISCDITHGRSLVDFSVDPHVDSFSFWNITFEGRSFGYQQIRRMITAAVAVAEEKISLSDVQQMLSSPSADGRIHGLNIVPPWGLYLTEVAHDEEDFSLSRVSKPHPYWQLVNLIDNYKAVLLHQLNKP